MDSRGPSSPGAGAAPEHLPAGAITADEQDIIWMMRVRGGDRAAFSDLVECHQQRVVGTIARMLSGDAAEAEDLGQQVFLRVWKSAPRYEPAAKFTTWLYTITRNLVFNELRRRKHRPVSSWHADPAHGESGGIGAEERFEDLQAASPDATLLEAELQQAIDAAIAQLPETQRLAIILRRYEELSYEEIAHVLKLTVPAVKSLLFRARGLLRERLAKYLDA
jgi:RNA polymerase sigma-70 factor (ECF subfamily)